MPAVLTVPIDKQDLRSCVKCGRMAHGDAAECTHPARAIDKIGCEIEGYWHDVNALTVKARAIGATWASDGSLGGHAVCDNSIAWRNYNDGRAGSTRPTIPHSGDCPICRCQALEIRTQPGSLAAMGNQIAALYPDAVSGYASLHVHVSFLDPMSISLIACKEFHNHFRTSITEFCNAQKLPAGHWLRKRIRGEDSSPAARPGTRAQYCQIERWLGEFPRVPVYGGHPTTGEVLQERRYDMINYLAFANHGTVEFRVGSAFADPREALAYVTHLHDMIESWIAEKGDQLASVTLGDVNGHEMRANVEIAASPDVPELFSGEVTLAAGDFEIPAVRPGARLATIQTALHVAQTEARDATEDHILVDRATGTPRLRARPRRASERP